MDEYLRVGERVDNIGFGNLRLIQKPEDFCYGIDAVLLASFAEIKKNARVIDLGSGTGIIPLIVSHKSEASEILGVELQKDSFERGIRNISLNKLEDKIKFFNCDVNEIIEKQNIIPCSFDVVLTNPPYMKDNGGLKNKRNEKMIARHETTATLSDFIEIAACLLKDRGDFYMIHRPNRLVDISVLCRMNKLEPKKIRLVSPDKDKKPNILLIHCVKNGRPELKFLDPLYVYDENGEYTKEIMQIYEKE